MFVDSELAVDNAELIYTNFASKDDYILNARTTISHLLPHFVGRSSRQFGRKQKSRLQYSTPLDFGQVSGLGI